MERRLTVLHTNDFHNILRDGQIERIKRVKQAAGPDAALLDAGDAISAGNVGVRLGGEPILAAMSELGYAAMAMGNREFHIAGAALRHKIGNARFPVLCANIRFRDDRGEALPVTPNAIIETPGGIRVGVFGVTVPMVTPRMAARHVSAFLFDEPLGAAKTQIETLRGDVDVLILLSHAGYRADLKIAAECPQLDLIVGGHSHVVLNAADRSASVPVVQAGSHGRYIGRAVLTCRDSRWTLAESGLIPLVPGAGDAAGAEP